MMQKKKSNFTKAWLPVAAMLLTVLLGSCSQIFNPQIDPPTIPAEMAELHLNIAEARTVFPDGNLQYRARLTATGMAPVDSEPFTGGSAVMMAPEGTWNLTVDAWYDGRNVARATRNNIVLTSGQTTNVNLTLEPLWIGVGTFEWAVTFPSVVNEAWLHILCNINRWEHSINLLDDSSVNLDGDRRFGEFPIDSGAYRVRVVLRSGNLQAGQTAAVHIYSGMTTRINWEFEEDDLAPPITLSGTINVTYGGQPVPSVVITAYDWTEGWSAQSAPILYPGANASWSITSFPPGTPRNVWLTIQGYNSGGAQLFEIMASSPVHVDEGDISDIVLNLGNVVTLSGTVNFEGADVLWIEISVISEWGHAPAFGIFSSPANGDPWSISMSEYPWNIWFMVDGETTTGDFFHWSMYPDPSITGNQSRSGITLNLGDIGGNGPPPVSSYIIDDFSWVPDHIGPMWPYPEGTNMAQVRNGASFSHIVNAGWWWSGVVAEAPMGRPAIQAGAPGTFAVRRTNLGTVFSNDITQFVDSLPMVAVDVFLSGPGEGSTRDVTFELRTGTHTAPPSPHVSWTSTVTHAVTLTDPTGAEFESGWVTLLFPLESFENAAGDSLADEDPIVITGWQTTTNNTNFRIGGVRLAEDPGPGNGELTGTLELPDWFVHRAPLFATVALDGDNSANTYQWEWSENESGPFQALAGANSVGLPMLYNWSSPYRDTGGWLRLTVSRDGYAPRSSNPANIRRFMHNWWDRGGTWRDFEMLGPTAPFGLIASPRVEETDPVLFVGVSEEVRNYHLNLILETGIADARNTILVFEVMADDAALFHADALHDLRIRFAGGAGEIVFRGIQPLRDALAGSNPTANWVEVRVPITQANIQYYPGNWDYALVNPNQLRPYFIYGSAPTVAGNIYIRNLRLEDPGPGNGAPTEWTTVFAEIDDVDVHFHVGGGGAGFIEVQRIFVNTSASETGATELFNFTSTPTHTTDDSGIPMWWANTPVVAEGGTANGRLVIQSEGDYIYGGGFASLLLFYPNNYIGFVVRTGAAGVGNARFSFGSASPVYFSSLLNGGNGNGDVIWEWVADGTTMDLFNGGNIALPGQRGELSGVTVRLQGGGPSSGNDLAEDGLPMSRLLTFGLVDPAIPNIPDNFITSATHAPAGVFDLRGNIRITVGWATGSGVGTPDIHVQINNTQGFGAASPHDTASRILGTPSGSSPVTRPYESGQFSATLAGITTGLEFLQNATITVRPSANADLEGGRITFLRVERLPE